MPTTCAAGGSPSSTGARPDPGGRAAPAGRGRRGGRRAGAVGGRRRASPCCGSVRRPGAGPARRWCGCWSAPDSLHRSAGAGGDVAVHRAARTGCRRRGRGARPPAGALPAGGRGSGGRGRSRAPRPGCPPCSACGRARPASPRCAPGGRAPEPTGCGCPIGVDERGAPVVLDLKESAQGGSGPHGLCIGATGSGKSELLRTLVLGLAATHSPDGAEPGAGRLQGRRDVPRARRRCRTSPR